MNTFMGIQGPHKLSVFQQNIGLNHDIFDVPAGLQRSAGHFKPLSDMFLSWWLVNISSHSFFSLSDILCVLSPAGQNVRQGLGSLPDISRSLPDMSGIFHDHWFWHHFAKPVPNIGGGEQYSSPPPPVAAKIITGMLDKMSPCQTFSPVDDR